VPMRYSALNAIVLMLKVFNIVKCGAVLLEYFSILIYHDIV